MLLSQLFYELGRLQFHTQLDETWLPFYQKFITSEFGQDYVVENSVGGRPLILALLGLSETFLQIFDYQLSQNTASRLVDIVPMLRPVHRVRALRFVETVNHEAFVQLVCSIPLAELDGDAQVQLISVLREHADVEIIRDHMQHTFTWKILGEAVQLSPGNLDLMIETAQVIQAGDFIQLLRYVLQPAYYQALLLGLTQGPFRQRVQSALVLHFLVHRGGAKAAQYLKEHAVVDVNPIAIFEQRFEKEATALLSQTAPVIKTLFPPTAGYTHIYLLGGAEQCLCPISQAIVSRLRLDNDAYHKLVCETNGVKTDLELTGQLGAVYVLDVLTKSILGVFDDTRIDLLQERPLISPFFIDRRETGAQNLQRLLEIAVEKNANLPQLYSLLGLTRDAGFPDFPQNFKTFHQFETLPVRSVRDFISKVYPRFCLSISELMEPRAEKLRELHTQNEKDLQLLQRLGDKQLHMTELLIRQLIHHFIYYHETLLQGTRTHRNTLNSPDFFANKLTGELFSQEENPASEAQAEARFRNYLCYYSVLRLLNLTASYKQSLNLFQVIAVLQLTKTTIFSGIVIKNSQACFFYKDAGFKLEEFQDTYPVVRPVTKQRENIMIHSISGRNRHVFSNSIAGAGGSSIMARLGFSQKAADQSPPIPIRNPKDALGIAPTNAMLDSKRIQFATLQPSCDSGSDQEEIPLSEDRSQLRELAVSKYATPSGVFAVPVSAPAKALFSNQRSPVVWRLGGRSEQPQQQHQQQQLNLSSIHENMCSALELDEVILSGKKSQTGPIRAQQNPEMSADIHVSLGDISLPDTAPPLLLEKEGLNISLSEEMQKEPQRPPLKASPSELFIPPEQVGPLKLDSTGLRFVGETTSLQFSYQRPLDKQAFKLHRYYGGALAEIPTSHYAITVKKNVYQIDYTLTPMDAQSEIIVTVTQGSKVAAYLMVQNILAPLEALDSIPATEEGFFKFDLTGDLQVVVSPDFLEIDTARYPISSLLAVQQEDSLSILTHTQALILAGETKDIWTLGMLVNCFRAGLNPCSPPEHNNICPAYLCTYRLTQTEVTLLHTSIDTKGEPIMFKYLGNKAEFTVTTTTVGEPIQLDCTANGYTGIFQIGDSTVPLAAFSQCQQDHLEALERFFDGTEPIRAQINGVLATITADEETVFLHIANESKAVSIDSGIVGFPNGNTVEIVEQTMARRTELAFGSTQEAKLAFMILSAAFHQTRRAGSVRE